MRTGGLRLVEGGAGACPDGRAWHPSQAPRPRLALYIGGERRTWAPLARAAKYQKPAGFVVARGGRAGRRSAIDRIPRMILMEDDLPDIDAAALVTELRRQIVPAAVPIVVLARDGTPGERARFAWAGASGYVCEPRDSVRISRAVGLLLDVSSWR